MIAAMGAFMVGNAVGLLDPALILGVTGLSIADPSAPAYQLGEIRAVYGGLFAVVGIFTLLSAIDPVASRSRLVKQALERLLEPLPRGGRALRLRRLLAPERS
jgi:hypothetical protein